MTEQAPRKLTRSSDDKVVGGVAAGLARHLGVDPILVRVAFVIITLAWGVGLLGYVALLFFVPDDKGERVSPPTTLGAILAVTVVVLACLLGFAGTDQWAWSLPWGGLIALVLLAAAAVFAWRAADGRDDGPARLGRLTLIVVGLMFAGVLGLGAGLAAAAGAGAGAAAVVVVCGLALIVAAFRGGARWLIVPAFLVATPVALVAASDLSLEGGFGERTYRVERFASLSPLYRLGAGELRVDLRRLAADLPSGRTVVRAKLGAGSLQIAVPADTCVAFDVKVGAGELNSLGQKSEGIDVSDSYDPRVSPSTPVVVIDAEVGFGEIQIHRGDDAFSGGRYYEDPASPQDQAACR